MDRFRAHRSKTGAPTAAGRVCPYRTPAHDSRQVRLHAVDAPALLSRQHDEDPASVHAPEVVAGGLQRRQSPVENEQQATQRGSNVKLPAFLRVSLPVESGISKRLYRHISQSVCPWNVKFSQELADDSPFRAREFSAGKDAVTLATGILALGQEQFSGTFRKSPMTLAKLAGPRRNSEVALTNSGV
jgi:hypothetical protein